MGRQTLDALPTNELVSNFLNRAIPVIGPNVTGKDITHFLYSLRCNNGGKHAYYRVLRVFYNWLYSSKSGYGLNPQDNPILNVDALKVEKRILPSLTAKQIESLIIKVDNVSDKVIISLLADSGMRLNGLANVKANDMDWDSYTITIIGKGNKQRIELFTEKTASLLRIHLADNYETNGSIWGMRRGGIETMLKRLDQEMGIKCNAHSFRRGFACNLH